MGFNSGFKGLIVDMCLGSSETSVIFWKQNVKRAVIKGLYQHSMACLLIRVGGTSSRYGGY